MTQKKRFNFIEKTNLDGETSLVPYLPLKLVHKDYSLKTLGLLDTGASVNVLPYQLGLELGLNWENLNIIVSLTGNLAQFPAKGVILKVEIETFSSVLLAGIEKEIREQKLKRLEKSRVQGKVKA